MSQHAEPTWRTHSCVPCRDSSRHLPADGKPDVGTSADAARDSACATSGITSGAPRQSGVTNIVVAGLGGQGVLKASDIIAGAAFLAGLDVKKSEVHGMSQRGGSVASDVRFGARVFSPMVSQGEADILLVLDPGQIEVNRALLAPGGVLIEPGMLEGRRLRSSKALNVALVGVLSRHLDFPEALWTQALRSNLAPKLLELNLEAFAIGRDAAEPGGAGPRPAY